MSPAALSLSALTYEPSRLSAAAELLVLDAQRPTAQVGEGWAFIVHCQRGGLRLRLPHAQPLLAGGESLLCSQDLPATLILDRGSQALLLRIEQQALRAGLQRIDPTHRFDPMWITAVHHDSHALGDALASIPGEAAARSVADAALQRCLREALALDLRYAPLQRRCAGRTSAQRRAVLARFERTRLRYAWSEQLLDADVDDLASCTAYTRWHFIRSFTAIYGESPAEFLREVRLNWCAAKLAETDLAISEIACMAGYGSHASFARAFRSHYGRCASEWRFAHVAPQRR